MKTDTNILDYIRWRGDLSFKQSAFNEVDALILARFSYMDLSGIVSAKQTSMTLQKAYQKYQKEKRHVFWEFDPLLFELLSQSKRFSQIRLRFYEEKFSEDLVEQFCAITLSLNATMHYISFRGTDNTLTGWKEDLMMTFEDHVKAQLESVAYVKKISEQLKGNFYLGGHSKGGNLAMYASIFNSCELQSRLKHVYSFDGPGLHEKMVHEVKQLKNLPSNSTYVPQSSIIGRMLTQLKDSIVVYSNAKGFFQHDIYSWNIERTQIQRSEEESAFSRIFDQTFHDYLEKLSRSEREQVVNILFEALDQCEESTLKDLKKHLIKNFMKISGHLIHLDDASSSILKEAMMVLSNSLTKGIVEEISDSIPLINEKEK